LAVPDILEKNESVAFPVCVPR